MTTDTPAELAINALRLQAHTAVKSMINAYYQNYARDEQEQTINQYLELLEQLHSAIHWIRQAQSVNEPSITQECC